MFSNFHIMASAVTMRVHRTMLQRLKLNTAVLNILTVGKYAKLIFKNHNLQNFKLGTSDPLIINENLS